MFTYVHTGTGFRYSDRAGAGHTNQYQQQQQQQQQQLLHQPPDQNIAGGHPTEDQILAAAANDETIEEAGEDGAAQDAGMQNHLNSDLVPYGHPGGELLANGALENQMSAEISALMKAALHSGRQIDVELPSGAIMRIR